MAKDAVKHNDRSIFFAILVPMVILIFAEALLLLGVLSGSGIIERLNQNDREDMDKRVEARKDHLQSYLLGMGGYVDALAKQVNASAAELVEEGGLDVLDLAADPATSARLLNEAVNPMVEALRACNSSGVFVVLNAADLSQAHDTGVYGRKEGIYIRDASPGDSPSVRNDDLSFVRAPSDVVRSHALATSGDWHPTFDYVQRVYANEYDYLYVPFQAAFETAGAKDAQEFAYWSVAPLIGTGTEKRAMAYSIPLVLPDGSVYGVVGVDLSGDYLKTLLPYSELLNDDDGSYMLARTASNVHDLPAGQDAQVSPVVCFGFNPIENTEYGRLFSVVRGSSSATSFHTSNGQYYISCEHLGLYNANSPVADQQWLLMGLMPQSTLHRFSEQTSNMMGWAALLMLLLGFVGSVLVGLQISRPLRRLSDEVAQAEMEGQECVDLSKIGITEVDKLTGAISTLSMNVASARRLEQERLEYERDYDLLTGLMNRRAFYRRAGEIFNDPEKLGNAAILMLDLDNLKTYNDAYGHDCGDKYIHTAARCFESGVPDHVLVSRVSGDEFFLLFYGYDSREEMEADIEKLRKKIPQTEFVLPDGKLAHLTASGGVALYLEDSSEFDELMKLADFTMYQVKESGKNNIAYFDFDTYQRKSSALRAEAEFDDLMANFELADYHFQPLFDARTGEVAAYEALMRVSLGVLRSPADVLALARSKNRLVDIERLTWIRSLECYEQLAAKGEVDPNAYLFVNSFANLSLSADELAGIALRFKDTMGRVVIEVTEGEDMDEQATAIKRAIPGTTGFFALDDYGSGYNSEVKLLTLRPKFVKVDISIIRDINLSADKQRMVSHVVEYAHERDMLIIAEGVESAEEVQTLLELDVDLLQGYYLSRPAFVPTQLSGEAAAQIAAFRSAGLSFEEVHE